MVDITQKENNEIGDVYLPPTPKIIALSLYINNKQNQASQDQTK